MTTIDDNWALLLHAAEPHPVDRPMTDAVTLAVAIGRGIDPDSLGCSFTLGDGEGFVTPAASDARALSLDEAQYRFDAGPCVAAARSRAWQDVEDVTAETRWPPFVATAVACGVASSLSLPVAAAAGPAALNLYSARQRAYTDDRRRAVAGFLARCLSAALTPSGLGVVEGPSQLHDSTDRGRLIMRAVRALSAARGIDDRAAYRVLTEATRVQERPLVAVAQDVLSAVESAA